MFREVGELDFPQLEERVLAFWDEHHVFQKLRKQNMGDWCISRKRYWGLPLPFYESDDGELVVVGSRAELRELATDQQAVDALPELHRPWIDAVEIRTPAGKTARRVTEVGDCWLDAGIAPFSTLGYLDGNREHFADWFPADFVVEMRADPAVVLLHAVHGRGTGGPAALPNRHDL